MAIITISRGSYSHGKEIAEKASQNLGYDCISRETLLKASKDFNITEISLLRAFEDTPSFLDRFTHGKERYIAYIQAALLKYLKKDNIIYHGFAYHFIVKDIPRLLNIRIIADIKQRAKIVMQRDGLSGKEALRFLNKVDLERRKWSRSLYGIDPEDPMLYDLILNINKITVEDAIETICKTASLKQFQTTPESKEVLEDLALAAEVKTFLINVKPSAEVCIENGFVSLKTQAPVGQESALIQKVGEIMKMIPGIRGIEVLTESHKDDRFMCLTDPSLPSAKHKTATFFTELG